MAGFVKFYRETLDHPVVHKDNDYYVVWSYLLLNANFEEGVTEFNGELFTVKPGQMIRGRKQISEKCKVNESKIERILKRFEIEQMIEQQTSTRKRLITILNWKDYQITEQLNEQLNEQQLNNKRTTSEQQLNTNKNNKEVLRSNKNNKDISRFTPPTLDEVVTYAKEKNQSEDLAKRFYDYFTTGDWIDSKGKKVKNWKQKFITWISYNGGTQNKRVGRIEKLSDYSIKAQEPLTPEEELQIKKEFEDLKIQLEKIGQ